jgi:hypothetical protein
VSEENLERLRRRGASYLVGTPRAQLKAYERRLLEGDWQSVSGQVEVQLIAEDNKETYVLARSRARAQKESAMRWRVVRGLMRALIRLLRHGRLKDPGKVLLHLGRLKERYRQAWRYVKISVEDLCLSWRWDRDALRLAASRDGAYLLRTNLEGSDLVKLWTQYIQLTEVEAVFCQATVIFPHSRCLIAKCYRSKSLRNCQAWRFIRPFFSAAVLVSTRPREPARRR